MLGVWPWSCVNTEVVLGSRSKMDSLVAELFSTGVSVDTVLVNVFPITVET